MLLRSSSSPILSSIHPILSQSEALKELEPESSLSGCKSVKLLSSSCAFGSGICNSEAELLQSPPKSFKRANRVAVVVDRMGSEKPSISERKNNVLRPGGGGKEGSGLSPVVKDGAMYIARGNGIAGGNREVSSVDSVFDCTEVYYQKMLEANPGNSLLLRNYAKFLHEVQGNLAKAEEYYERAILASPSDGEVLALYAKLKWEVRRDARYAEAYFDQAVQANPDDCFVLGSYAHFLWDSEEVEAKDIDSEMQQKMAAPVMSCNSATEAIV